MELHLMVNSNTPKDKHAGLLPFISVEDSPKGSSQTADSEGSRDDTPKMSSSSYTTTMSSSSSNTYSDDSSQVNMLLRSSAQNNVSMPICRDATGNDRADDFSKKALFRSEESVDESRTSQCSDITHESFVQGTPPTQSPTAQVMKRSPGVHDPNRIPTSIFSGPPTPTDWSIASNDSLFSLHVGTNSFSKDVNFKMSTELQRPEELHRSKELSEDLRRSGEGYNSGKLYPNGDVEKSDLYQFEQFYKSSELIELDESARSKNFVPAKNGKEESTVGTRQPGTNFQSSPFPKKKKSSCLHCHCFNCCEKLFCCFKCSACSCKWLSCSGCSCKFCSWTSCSCCSWSSCCSCHCPSCTWACCSCWKIKPKKLCYGSTYKDII